MAGQSWLVKSEPSTYSYERLVKDGRTTWDGVRNFAARNNLRAMNNGDLVLFYHSNIGKEVVGIARVVREAFKDASEPDEDWSAVDLAPFMPLTKPVSLEVIKKTPELLGMMLVKRSRLSVVPVLDHELRKILVLGDTKLPRG